jgi:hypothetical protein
MDIYDISSRLIDIFTGKFLPAIGAAIQDHNDVAKSNDRLHIPLKSLAIGNQW